ncbi:ABC-type drug export system, membrane protein [Bacillus sp. JCM 19045]|nr:ABC-type drug export system, membrane protein [Bacillus sp. JCM 19045]
MTILIHSLYMGRRHLIELARSPYIIIMNIIQPVLYLLLFSALFQAIVDIPGFASSSYLSFFSPGIVIMSAVMAGSYGGLSIIMDDKQGILDRFLIAPTNRLAILAGPLLRDSITVTVQVVIMLGLAYLLGARFESGVIGFIVLLICSILIGVAFGALSIALALLVRNEQALTSFVGFLTMPVLFLSSLFMPLDLVPNWIGSIAQFNPIHWAITGSRDALMNAGNSTFIAQQIFLLVLFMVTSFCLALLAFRSYQRKM